MKLKKKYNNVKKKKKKKNRKKNKKKNNIKTESAQNEMWKMQHLF